ncbi:nuclear transport factor 2 family protein [Chryseobacterium sp. 2TAF14]|uniref:YybH family protein n=1 Tax=Chryseobacterium sp. 2TAF14 TaxID=3233007 RepID=UPI003F917AB5
MIGQDFVERSVFSLSKTPEGIVDSFLAHMNSFNTEIMLGFYEEDAIFIGENGKPRRGRLEIARELDYFFKFGLPVKITTRNIYVDGNLASLILDWIITGNANNGEKVYMRGTSNDYAKRGRDGYWRYWFENPFGIQVRSLF